MRRRPASAPPPLPTAVLGAGERLACLRLIRSENVGPATFRRLINHFGGAQAALDALPALSERGGLRRPIRICSVDAAESELASAAEIGARPLFAIEPGYPHQLAVTEGAPPLLYILGDASLLSRPTVGIVGSREASAAGRKLARQFASDLGRAGYVVVSGLAIGIDAAAHDAALETGTVAVVAGGVNVAYPPANTGLQASIAERGCLVSERPPGFEPRGRDFPRRNRIISGLSLGIVVIEAARRSGSLITARRAADQGREVFAVPGHPLDPRAEGTNHLLKEGAALATSARDIIDALRPLHHPQALEAPDRGLTDADGGDAPHEPPPPVAQTARSQVVSALGPAPVNVDELGRTTGLPIRVVQAILLELALAGRLEYHGSHLVSLIGDPV